MLKKVKLSDKEMREFAEVFADYSYGDNETGMVPLYPGYPDKTRLINYLIAIIRTANEYNGVYATSDRKEGIIILTDTTHPYPGSAMIKMMWRMIRALGIKNFSNMMKKFQAGGASLEKKYRKSKKRFVQIELLPVIVTTDAKIKKDKYAHIGMSHINTRKLGDRSFLYDLVREA